MRIHDKILTVKTMSNNAKIAWWAENKTHKNKHKQLCQTVEMFVKRRLSLTKHMLSKHLLFYIDEDNIFPTLNHLYIQNNKLKKYRTATIIKLTQSKLINDGRVHLLHYLNWLLRY